MGGRARPGAFALAQRRPAGQNGLIRLTDRRGDRVALLAFPFDFNRTGSVVVVVSDPACTHLAPSINSLDNTSGEFDDTLVLRRTGQYSIQIPS